MAEQMVTIPAGIVDAAMKGILELKQTEIETGKEVLAQMTRIGDRLVDIATEQAKVKQEADRVSIDSAKLDLEMRRYNFERCKKEGKRAEAGRPAGAYAEDNS